MSAISSSEKIIPTTIEYLDIAGLVKGASQGEGLGNKFLSNIRECDSIVQVTLFKKSNSLLSSIGGLDTLEILANIHSQAKIKGQAFLRRQVTTETCLGWADDTRK